MKTLLVLFLFVASVQGADVVFNLKDFGLTVQPLQKRTVEIQPRFTASSNSTNIITSERKFYNLGTNAVFTVTNMTDGIYWCYAYGLTYTTRFAVNIPSTNGTLTASDYITSTGTGLETENGIPIDLE